MESYKHDYFLVEMRLFQFAKEKTILITMAMTSVAGLQVVSMSAPTGVVRQQLASFGP